MRRWWWWKWGAEVFIILFRRKHDARREKPQHFLEIPNWYIFCLLFRMPFVLIFPINILFSYFLFYVTDITHRHSVENLSQVKYSKCLVLSVAFDVWGVQIICVFFLCELIKAITTLKMWQISHASHGRNFSNVFRILCFLHANFSLALRLMLIVSDLNKR